MSSDREETISLLLKIIDSAFSPAAWEACFGEAAIVSAPRQAVQFTVTPGHVSINVVDASGLSEAASDAVWEAEKQTANASMKAVLSKLNQPPQG